MRAYIINVWTGWMGLFAIFLLKIIKEFAPNFFVREYFRNFACSILHLNK